MAIFRGIFRVLDTVRRLGPRKVLALAWGRFVYRKVLLHRYEVQAGLSQPPPAGSPLRLDFLAKPAYRSILGTNPHLTEDDVKHFDEQESVCIAVWDDQKVAASSWMTHGRVYVVDLGRHVQVPHGEHFSCRTYVSPEYRGHSLLGHMIHGYTHRQPAGDVVWGLIYPWNTPSVRGCERLGWRHTGDYWTRFLFGLKFPGERHFDPRPPMTGGDDA